MMTTTTTTTTTSSSQQVQPQQVQQQNQHSFEVFVSNDSFKFNAAHFVAFAGYRERLHGHNYRVSVRLRGSSHIGPDGYVLDFGCIKTVTRQVCKELNEHFLCPTLSNVINITTETITTTTRTTTDSPTNDNFQQQQHAQSQQQQQQVRLQCEDGSVFVFPAQDCAMLPLVHATTEELAIYLWGRLLEGLHPDYLRGRGITNMQVTVSEAPQQEATFSRDIPPPPASAVKNDAATAGNVDHTTTSTAADDAAALDNPPPIVDVRTYIQNGDVIPMPCLERTLRHKASKPSSSSTTTSLCACCSQQQTMLSQSLQRLADSLNSQRPSQGQEGGSSSSSLWTVQDLEAFLNAQP